MIGLRRFLRKVANAADDVRDYLRWRREHGQRLELLISAATVEFARAKGTVAPPASAPANGSGEEQDPIEWLNREMAKSVKEAPDLARAYEEMTKGTEVDYAKLREQGARAGLSWNGTPEQLAEKGAKLSEDGRVVTWPDGTPFPRRPPDGPEVTPEPPPAPREKVVRIRVEAASDEWRAAHPFVTEPLRTGEAVFNEDKPLSIPVKVRLDGVSGFVSPDGLCWDILDG